MSETPTQLTFEQEITAAYLFRVRNVKVMDIATAFGINMGRVSEAVTRISKATKARGPHVGEVENG